MAQSPKQWIRTIFKKLKTLKKQDIKNILLIFALVLVIVHAIYVTLIYFDREYNFTILNRTYVSAVAPDQSINDVLSTDIVVIREVDIEELSPGDQIISYGDYGVNEYWVMQVNAVNETTNQVTYTYDGTVAFGTLASDIIGRYDHSANFIGTLYFSATFIRGYILLIMIHLFIIATAYFITYEHKEEQEQ